MTNNPLNDMRGIFRNSLLIIIGLVVASCLIALGFWQLHRAAYKKQLLATYASQQSQPSITLTQALRLYQKQPHKLRYRQTHLTGKWLVEKTIFLDNQIVDHRVGYDMLVPFTLDDSALTPLLIVNVGWVAGDPTRKRAPQPPDVSSLNNLSATFELPPEKIFLLGKNLEMRDNWPAVIQAIDLTDIQTHLQQDIYPFIARVNMDAIAHRIMPSTHYGYAVQWFGLSIVFCVIFWRVLRQH